VEEGVSGRGHVCLRAIGLCRNVTEGNLILGLSGKEVIFHSKGNHVNRLVYESVRVALGASSVFITAKK